MTLTRSAIDPTEALAHMSPRALLAHIRAAVDQLALIGVAISSEAQRGVDEIEECIVEHEHRRPVSAISLVTTRPSPPSPFRPKGA